MNVDESSHLARRLASLADAQADSGRWPAEAMAMVAEAGIWKWVIPSAHGGDPLDGRARIEGYEALASGCLSTALIVTQQHGACELIVEGDNDALKYDRLPGYADGRRHCTLGISQVTTSQRGGPRQMSARRDGKGFRIDGRVPWSSAPAHCDDMVIAAVLDDDQQLLACLPLDAPGVRVGEPMKLMALEQSWTTWVDCDDVQIPADWVIRGPTPKVLDRRSTVKPLTVSAVGTGVATALLDIIDGTRAKYGADFHALMARCAARHDAVRQALYAGVRDIEGAPDKFSATAIRVQVNDLVSRLAMVALTLSKGSGYARDHRAQRLCREAMFFLVWSCPTPVQQQSFEHILSAWPDA